MDLQTLGSQPVMPKISPITGTRRVYIHPFYAILSTLSSDYIWFFVLNVDKKDDIMGYYFYI